MKEIDWEERYFEMVKAIVTGKLASGSTYNFSINDGSINQILRDAKKIVEALHEKAYLQENETPE